MLLRPLEDFCLGNKLDFPDFDEDFARIASLLGKSQKMNGVLWEDIAGTYTHALPYHEQSRQNLVDLKNKSGFTALSVAMFNKKTTSPSFCAIKARTSNVASC